ncbi:MAG: hypothetical protein WBA22_05020 [Candidatus Methanofastidiosia archaeon]
MNPRFEMSGGGRVEVGAHTRRLHREDYYTTWGGGAEGGGGTPRSMLARSRQPEHFTGQTTTASRRVS